MKYCTALFPDLEHDKIIETKCAHQVSLNDNSNKKQDPEGSSGIEHLLRICCSIPSRCDRWGSYNCGWVYEAGREDCGKMHSRPVRSFVGEGKDEKRQRLSLRSMIAFLCWFAEGKAWYFWSFKKKNHSRTEVSVPWWMLSSKWAGPVKCWLHGFDQFWQMFSSMLSTSINTQVTSVILEAWLVFPSRQALPSPLMEQKMSVCISLNLIPIVMF